MLRVDSGGGSVVASEVIRREVELAHDVKPVVVSMSDVAASGGYWIAAPANKIVAEPNTITGSIGVIIGKFNVSGLYNLLGAEHRFDFDERQRVAIFEPTEFHAGAARVGRKNAATKPTINSSRELRRAAA